LKKVSALIIILAVIFAATSSSFAQPKLLIHVTGGYSLPLGELKGDLADAFATPPVVANPKKAYMKTGFNFGADIKYAFDKKGYFRGALGLGYNMFSNSYDLTTPVANTFKVKFNYFGFSIGPEVNFLPKGKANPFIGVDFTGNFYSGKQTWTTLDSNFTESTLTTGSRFGLAFGGGLDVKLGKKVGFVVGLKYNLINLIGKKAYDSTVTPTAGEYALYDKEYTQGGTTWNSMNLSDLKIYVGVTFFLMEPKKTVKK
jgi:hypothetical protein